MEKPTLDDKNYKRLTQADKIKNKKVIKNDGRHSTLELLRTANDIYFNINQKQIHLSEHEKSLLIPLLVERSLNYVNKSSPRFREPIRKQPSTYKRNDVNLSNKSKSENPKQTTKAIVTITSENAHGGSSLQELGKPKSKSQNIPIDRPSEMVVEGIGQNLSRNVKSPSSVDAQKETKAIIKEGGISPQHGSQKRNITFQKLQHQLSSVFQAEETLLALPERSVAIKDTVFGKSSNSYQSFSTLFSVNISENGPTQISLDIVFSGQNSVQSNLKPSIERSFIPCAIESKEKYPHVHDESHEAIVSSIDDGTRRPNDLRENMRSLKDNKTGIVDKERGFNMDIEDQGSSSDKRKILEESAKDSFGHPSTKNKSLRVLRGRLFSKCNMSSRDVKLVSAKLSHDEGRKSDTAQRFESSQTLHGNGESGKRNVSIVDRETDDLRKSQITKALSKDNHMSLITERPQSLLLPKQEEIVSFKAISVSLDKNDNPTFQTEMHISMCSENVMSNNTAHQMREDVKKRLFEQLSLKDTEGQMMLYKQPSFSEINIIIAEIGKFTRMYTDSDLIGSPAMDEQNVTSEDYRDQMAAMNVRDKCSTTFSAKISSLKTLSTDYKPNMESSGNRMSSSLKDISPTKTSSSIKIQLLEENKHVDMSSLKEREALEREEEIVYKLSFGEKKASQNHVSKETSERENEDLKRDVQIDNDNTRTVSLKVTEEKDGTLRNLVKESWNLDMSSLIEKETSQRENERIQNVLVIEKQASKKHDLKKASDIEKENMKKEERKKSSFETIVIEHTTRDVSSIVDGKFGTDSSRETSEKGKEIKNSLVQISTITKSDIIVEDTESIKRLGNVLRDEYSIETARKIDKNQSESIDSRVGRVHSGKFDKEAPEGADLKCSTNKISSMTKPDFDGEDTKTGEEFMRVFENVFLVNESSVEAMINLTESLIPVNVDNVYNKGEKFLSTITKSDSMNGNVVERAKYPNETFRNTMLDGEFVESEEISRSDAKMVNSENVRPIRKSILIEEEKYDQYGKLEKIADLISPINKSEFIIENIDPIQMFDNLVVQINSPKETSLENSQMDVSFKKDDVYIKLDGSQIKEKCRKTYEFEEVERHAMKEYSKSTTDQGAPSGKINVFSEDYIRIGQKMLPISGLTSDIETVDNFVIQRGNSNESEKIPSLAINVNVLDSNEAGTVENISVIVDKLKFAVADKSEMIIEKVYPLCALDTIATQSNPTKQSTKKSSGSIKSVVVDVKLIDDEEFGAFDEVSVKIEMTYSSDNISSIEQTAPSFNRIESLKKRGSESRRSTIVDTVQLILATGSIKDITTTNEGIDISLLEVESDIPPTKDVSPIKIHSSKQKRTLTVTPISSLQEVNSAENTFTKIYVEDVQHNLPLERNANEINGVHSIKLGVLMQDDHGDIDQISVSVLNASGLPEKSSIINKVDPQITKPPLQLSKESITSSLKSKSLSFSKIDTVTKVEVLHSRRSTYESQSLQDRSLDYLEELRVDIISSPANEMNREVGRSQERNMSITDQEVESDYLSMKVEHKTLSERQASGQKVSEESLHISIEKKTVVKRTLTDQELKLLKDDNEEKEDGMVDNVMKRIIADIEAVLLEQSTEEIADEKQRCDDKRREKLSKSSSCDKDVSEIDDNDCGVPIINYKTHTCFSSKAPIKVAHHEEHSHMKLFKCGDSQNQYKLTNTSWTKSELLLPNGSRRRVNNICPASEKKNKTENVDESLCKTENSMSPLSEREMSYQERTIPQIPRRCDGPSTHISPHMHRRKDDCIPLPYGYKKVRIPDQNVPNGKYYKNDDDFVIPKDGIFGRDPDEGKFVTFCCNSCHTWISHGNREEHLENCVNNNMEKETSGVLKSPTVARTIKSMPGVVCYICGRRFTRHTIINHEKTCLIKWSKMNKNLDKSLRKTVPEKPHIDNSNINQLVKEQMALGNKGYTAEDAINDLYYKASCKNAINLYN